MTKKYPFISKTEAAGQSVSIPRRARAMTGSKAASKAAKSSKDAKEQEPLKIQNLGDMAQIKRVLDETAVAVRDVSFFFMPDLACCALTTEDRPERATNVFTERASRAYARCARIRPSREPLRTLNATRRLSSTWGTTKDTSWPI